MNSWVAASIKKCSSVQGLGILGMNGQRKGFQLVEKLHTHGVLPGVRGFRLALSAHPELHRQEEKRLCVCVKDQDHTFFKKKNVTKDTYGMRSDTTLSLVNHSLVPLWHFKPLAESEYSFVVPLLLT